MGTESAEEEDAPDGRLEPGVRWAMLLPYHCFVTFGHVADTIVLACVPVLGFGFSEGSLGTGREESLCQETSCGTLGQWLQPLALWLIPTARWLWGFILSTSRWRYQMWAQSSPFTLCWCHLYYHSLLRKPLIQIAVRSPGRNWVWVYLWGSQRKDCQYKVVETISLVYRELGDKGKVLSFSSYVSLGDLFNLPEPTSYSSYEDSVQNWMPRRGFRDLESHRLSRIIIFLWWVWCVSDGEGG